MLSAELAGRQTRSPTVLPRSPRESRSTRSLDQNMITAKTNTEKGVVNDSDNENSESYPCNNSRGAHSRERKEAAGRPERSERPPLVARMPSAHEMPLLASGRIGAGGCRQEARPAGLPRALRVGAAPRTQPWKLCARSYLRERPSDSLAQAVSVVCPAGWRARSPGHLRTEDRLQ